MTEERQYCKDCINAKPKPDRITALWYCGKHRQFITQYTCVSALLDRDCKDYVRRTTNERI